MRIGERDRKSNHKPKNELNSTFKLDQTKLKVNHHIHIELVEYFFDAMSRTKDL